MKVRALEPDDAPAVIALRREALSSSPLAFGASLEDDRGLSLEFMRASLGNAASSAVLGAFDGEALVGMVGILRLADGASAPHCSGRPSTALVRGLG